MCFSLKNKALDVFKIKSDQKDIKVVSEFKYLVAIVDSKLKFDAHIKKMSTTIKTNLNCFRMIRPCISLKAAQVFMHAMILSHMTYCAIIWGQASQSVVKPVMSLYKQTLKVMDQKPMKWHHCQILQKYNLLSFDNLLKFSFIKTVFKCIHGLAPDIVCQLIQKLSSDGAKTRGAVSGNCRVRRRRITVGQSSFSVKCSHLWNTMPVDLKLQSEQLSYLYICLFVLVLFLVMIVFVFYLVVLILCKSLTRDEGCKLALCYMPYVHGIGCLCVTMPSVLSLLNK